MPLATAFHGLNPLGFLTRRLANFVYLIIYAIKMDVFWSHSPTLSFKEMLSHQ